MRPNEREVYLHAHIKDAKTKTHRFQSSRANSQVYMHSSLNITASSEARNTMIANAVDLQIHALAHCSRLFEGKSSANTHACRVAVYRQFHRA